MAAVAPRAITLGEANALYLDLTDVNDNRTYRNGMKALEIDKYDGKPKDMRIFMEVFKAKAIMYNWFDVLTVPDLTPAANLRNFMVNYGTVSLADCQAHANTYLALRDRAAQNSQMMYHCVADSLTNEAKADLMNEASKYTVAGYTDGLCFLKLMLSKAQTDTVATVNMLRSTISRLPSKIVELSGNICDFNNHVKNIGTALQSYGERADELMMNVMMAYEEVEDEDFVSYVKNKRNFWEEGQISLDLDSLMNDTENYYKIRVQHGKWKTVSKANTDLAAMKALYSKQQSNNNNPGHRNNTDGKKARLPYEERMKQDLIDNPWKYMAPKPGKPQTKVEKGATVHWCANHKRWLGHGTAQCVGVGVNMRSRNNNGNGNVAYEAHIDDDQNSLPEGALPITPKVQVNKAMMSLTQGGYALFD